MRLGLATLLAALCAGASLARAQTDWFASLYTNEGVELRADERLFALYALFNAMGYDEAPVVRAAPVPAREMHRVRLKVRATLRLDPSDEEKLDAFFSAHPSPAQDYGRYVLSLKGPGAFERSSASPDDLRGLEALLAAGWTRHKLADLFASVQDDYRADLKRYHGAIDGPVGAMRKLLRLKEDEPPRIVLAVNPLDGRGAAFSAMLGDELWVVVGPSPAPDLLAVVRELARSRLEPLVARAAADAVAAASATTVLPTAFAASVLALPDAQLEAGLFDGMAGFKELVRLVDAYGRSDRPLEAFLAEVVPSLGKDSASATKRPGKSK